MSGVDQFGNIDDLSLDVLCLGGVKCELTPTARNIKTQTTNDPVADINEPDDATDPNNDDDYVTNDTGL